MYSWVAMGPHGQGWTTGLVDRGMGQPLTASQGWTTGRVHLGQARESLEPGIPAAVKREAEKHIERLFGKAYELVPDAVKREIERRYIEMRLGELGVSGQIETARKVIPAALPILIGAAFLLLRR